MPLFGPIYCETPAVIAGFPAEPINTWTNLVTITFGVAALLLVYRRAPRERSLWVLALLLVSVGVGSFLWHGLRTRWALMADIVPGLLFLFSFIFLWARALLGTVRGIAFLGSIMLLQVIIFSALVPRSFGTAFALLVLLLLAGGLWLIQRTWQRDPSAAKSGAWVLGLGLLAAGMRMADRLTCDIIPFGTHWGWHIFLAAAAFVGIVMLVRLRR